MWSTFAAGMLLPLGKWLNGRYPFMVIGTEGKTNTLTLSCLQKLLYWCRFTYKSLSSLLIGWRIVKAVFSLARIVFGNTTAWGQRVCATWNVCLVGEKKQTRSTMQLEWTLQQMQPKRKHFPMSFMTHVNVKPIQWLRLFSIFPVNECQTWSPFFTVRIGSVVLNKSCIDPDIHPRPKSLLWRRWACFLYLNLSFHVMHIHFHKYKPR